MGGKVAAADSSVLSFRDTTVAAGLGNLAMQDGAWYGVAVAFADLDGDLWPDLYFGGGGGQYDQICINLRTGKFSCHETGAKRTNPALAIAAADLDSDGDLDLYVMSSGPNRLLENDGHGAFVDVAVAKKVTGNGTPTTTGTFFDYDGDGLLDLYLGHGDTGLDDTMYAPELLHQNADGTFTDVIAPTPMAQPKNTLAMIAFDYDADMRQDLLVTGNFDVVSLYHNDGGGHFTNVTKTESDGFQNAIHEGMGLDIADFDGDGDFDLYGTNSLNNPGNLGSGLFVNQGNGMFESMAAQYQVLAGFEWGTGWADFDNDTWPDLLAIGDSIESRFLYRNIYGQSFEQQTLPLRAEGPTEPCVTAAFADYDRDGRVDVILARLDSSPPELLHNETSSVGNWISIYLSGAPDPLGALVEVSPSSLADGEHVLRRQLLSQTSKGAQNERALHFGLGSAKSVDVTVTWPMGGVEQLQKIPVNAEISIEQGCASDSQTWPAHCNAFFAAKDVPPVYSAHGCDFSSGENERDGLVLVLVLLTAWAIQRKRMSKYAP